jgi:RNA polymerase sigma-70 factor (ECF subfamily)
MTGRAQGALPELSSPLARGEHFACVDDLARNQVQELYRRHSPKLIRQLTRATGCRDIARDLVHETFVRLMRMNPISFSRIDRHEAFLQRVSVNLLRDHGRGRVHFEHARKALAVVSDPTFDQVAVLEHRETLARLEGAMARLKPRTREIFLAQRIEGLSYAEIAERTGLSIKGVEKQMSKAIAKIDRMLDRV